jgi:hypothetical protein
VGASHPEGGDAMKWTFVIGSLGIGAAALLGCPVFSGGGSGDNCAYSNCPPPCYGEGCFETFDASAESSTPADSGTGGEVNCSVTGCDNGSVCTVVDAAAVCVPETDGAIEGATAPPFKGCTSNAECAGDGGTGSLCLDGTCVAPANQCTDGTQCPNSEQCVQGACVPACSASTPCPTGYSCNFLGDSGASGVCTGNPTPCGGADGGATCASGTTCVDQHCVPACSGGDAACGTGLVCVDNGCIPNQEPVFVCNADGVQGACDTGSICLHHSCYIACDPEASNSCPAATGGMFPLCKSVTASSVVYYVCASSSNLGSQCDPTSTPPLNCASPDICIDGYCR